MVLGSQGMRILKTTVCGKRNTIALSDMFVPTSRKIDIWFILLNRSFKEYPLYKNQMQEFMKEIICKLLHLLVSMWKMMMVQVVMMYKRDILTQKLV